MVTLAFRRAVVVLAAALATACLGGQTGQPTSGSCDSESLQPGAAWGGTTVQGAAQSFEGTYTASLQWQAEPRYAATHTPVELSDSVQLTINYDGAAGSNSCVGQLSVPVSVTLTSSDSGLAESGNGSLTIEPASDGTLVGVLHFETARGRFDATLDRTAKAARGSLDALDPALPGASAIFQ
jgi:hypothetical protein